MSERRSLRGIWLGPLLAFGAIAAYFALFMRWPALNDVPWPSLVLLALAVGLSTRALPRAWTTGGWLRRTAAAAGLTVSSLLALAFVYYSFVMSAALPEPGLALTVGDRVPPVTLHDDADRPVDLADLAAVDRGTTVLVFYRGFW